MTTVTSIGKFHVLGTLGTGAHSTILRIRRQQDGREYALKVVPIEDAEEAKFLEQARHEYRVAQMLDHPNLIKIHCLETQRDWLFRVRKAQLLIEFVDGKTLDNVPPLPMPKLIPVLAQIASGLVHMHRRGAFHADMKPNNVLFGKRGEVKIIDYGLAHIKGEPKDRIQGTPEYMAPETARSRVINEQTEVYNLGATMFRLATLKLPPTALPGPDGIQLTERTWNNLIKPPRELNRTIPEAFESLILRCLAFSPQKRPERMSEVRDELLRLAEEIGEPVAEGTDWS